MTNTVPQQMESLRTRLRPERVGRLPWVALLLTTALIVAGFWIGNPVPWMIALFTGVVSGSAFQSMPHIAAAHHALDAGRVDDGQVQISITRWSDSDTFHATTIGLEPHDWTMEFIPQGWHPAEGRCAARLHVLPDRPWPALIVTEHGLLFPRRTPQPVNPQSRST